jgi:hypothetical protein
MDQQWMVFSTKWFRGSLASLPATEEVQQVLLAVVRRLELAPTNIPCLEGTQIHLLKTHVHRVGGRAFPALRVFYFIDGMRVLLLWAEEYDEMDLDSDEEHLARFN